MNIALLMPDNRHYMARACIMAQIAWFIFNSCNGAWMGATCSVFIVISTINSMARYEGWDIGQCRRTFIPSILSRLFVFSNFRTYP